MITTPVLAARVRVHAAGWQEAIRAACHPLRERGAVSDAYVSRCVEIVAETGPYIVVAPGIALAHARPSDGAFALGLSAVTLAAPVRFGHPDNDPVDVVFAFASPSRDAHVGLLAALARRLSAGLADRLRRAESDAAATALLEEVVADAA